MQEAHQLSLPGAQSSAIAARAYQAKMQAIGSCVAKHSVQFHCDMVCKPVCSLSLTAICFGLCPNANSSATQQQNC